MSSLEDPPQIEGLVFERIGSDRLRVILYVERDPVRRLLTWLPVSHRPKRPSRPTPAAAAAGDRATSRGRRPWGGMT